MGENLGSFVWEWESVSWACLPLAGHWITREGRSSPLGIDAKKGPFLPNLTLLHRGWSLLVSDPLDRANPEDASVVCCCLWLLLLFIPAGTIWPFDPIDGPSHSLLSPSLG